jgi:hypothetical protein
MTVHMKIVQKRTLVRKHRALQYFNNEYYIHFSDVVSRTQSQYDTLKRTLCSVIGVKLPFPPGVVETTLVDSRRRRTAATAEASNVAECNSLVVGTPAKSVITDQSVHASQFHTDVFVRKLSPGATTFACQRKRQPQALETTADTLQSQVRHAVGRA